MLQEGITADDILNEMSEVIKNNNIKPPAWWLEQANKLNILSSDESKKLWKVRQDIALLKMEERKKQKAEYGKVNVSEVNLVIEASDVYRIAGELKDKIELIREQIRIAKAQARIENDEYRGY